MLGGLGYYLLLAAVYTLMSHSAFMVKNRKAVLGGLIFTGSLCIALFFLGEHEYTLAIGFGVVSLFGLIPFFQKLTGKDIPVQILDLPAGGYRINSLEELNNGHLTLRYVLKYNGNDYYLSTVPSAGEPAVRLFVHMKPGEKTHYADLVETGSNTTFKGLVNSLEKLLGFIAGLMLPLSLYIVDRSVSYSVFSTLLTITVSSIMCTVTANSTQLLGKAIRWLGTAMLVIGVLTGAASLLALFKSH